MSVEEDISPQLKRFAMYLLARESQDEPTPMEHDQMSEAPAPAPTWSEEESAAAPSTLGSEWAHP